MEKKTAFPADFTEYNTNEIDFGSHRVVYTFNDDVYEPIDNDDDDDDDDDKTELVGWEHHIEVWCNNGEFVEETYFQGTEDSCKWTFWETYERICKRLGLIPMGFAD
jgi:hypothetical protein